MSMEPIASPQASACHACGAALEPVPGLEVLGLASSDCRPWSGTRRLAWCPACGLLQKITDSWFQDDCRRIYESYAVYHQADGREQRVFSADGAACARSEHLLRRLLERGAFPTRGRLLDVGCGNGVLLKSFGALLPGWRLNGLDLGLRSREAVLALPRVEGFFCCDLGEVPGRFGMLSMMHCLEHVPSPAAFLGKGRALLEEGGLLLVQCPDFTANAFDLVIADHCTHFTPESLGGLAESSGFEVLVLERGLVAKELTLLARRTVAGPFAAVPGASACDVRPAARAALDWLGAVQGKARALAEAHGARFGVFGTSIGGAWLFGQMPERVRFFVDEDENRVGRKLFGRPVLRPSQVAPESVVYLCLPDQIARAIADRLAGRSGHLELPPAFPIQTPKEQP